VRVEFGGAIYISHRLSKIYLEKLNFLPVDKQMITDAIAELNSFHEHKHQVLLEEDLWENQQLVIVEVEFVVVPEVIVVEYVVPRMLMGDLEVVVVVE
nr:hypothetical protein [Tanacetum cinerariifolium]